MWGWATAAGAARAALKAARGAAELRAAAELQAVALWKLEGYTNDEIAAKLIVEEKLSEPRRPVDRPPVDEQLLHLRAAAESAG